MLKYRIIHKEIVCDGLDKNDDHNVLLQMQSQESKILEVEEYKVTRDDMNRQVKGLGRDPDLYE